VVELAEIFHHYGPLYREKFSQRIPASHRQTMAAIEHCRTEVLGGHIFYCQDCHETLYSYHSCKNRHCPKCQNETAEQWLLKQQQLLLPLPHFMVTFTLPAQLRAVARSHPKSLYNILFRASAAALQQLADDPRFVGGKIGLIGVLHTWTRELNYHPHVHYLVPAGALAADGQAWLPSRKSFLVHVKPLSILFRAKFRAELKKTALFDLVPAETWTKDWVVHSKAVGDGKPALKYLATYVFRVAISNNRLVKVQDDLVTFHYKDSNTGKKRYRTLPAEEFIRRFLQHVLPKGFMKVRYYGLFSPGNRHLLKQVGQLLQEQSIVQPPDDEPAKPVLEPQTETIPQAPCMPCPKCARPMQLLETLKAKRCRSP
jgi:hypothetical protein